MPASRHDDLSLRYVLSVPGVVGEDAPAPLVLVLHGRGADANDLADIAPLIDPGGCRFVFPNAPRPFEPYPGLALGFSWFDGWPPEGETFAASRTQLLQFIDQILARYPATQGRLLISGFSQGGMMALDLGFRVRQPVAGVVCMSGALNENDLPSLDAHRDRPVLVVHGTEDAMIPVAAARRTRLLLEEHNLHLDYHEFEMGHEVTQESLAVVAAFIARCLAAVPDPAAD